MTTVYTGRTALDLYRMFHMSDRAIGIAIEDGRPYVACTRLNLRECQSVMADGPKRRGGADERWRILVNWARALQTTVGISPQQTRWLESIAPDRQPVHVLVGSWKRRPKARNVTGHVLGAPLVRGSILRMHLEMPSASSWEPGGLIPDIFVTSPELTFLMLAREAGRSLPGLVRLVLAGYELCGHYLLPPRGLAGPGAMPTPKGDDGFRMIREPLTSRRKIAVFLDNLERACGSRSRSSAEGPKEPSGESEQRVRGGAEGSTRPNGIGAQRVRGCRTARLALDQMLDHAGSPMETRVGMLLAMGRVRGGYGLPNPELNEHVHLSKRARTMARKDDVYPDLLWRDASGRRVVSVEYHSNARHTDNVSGEKVREDMHRNNAVVEMGIAPILVTFDQLMVQREFDAVAGSVARQLGCQQRPANPRMLRRRALLRYLLLGANAIPAAARARARADAAECDLDPF